MIFLNINAPGCHVVLVFYFLTDSKDFIPGSGIRVSQAVFIPHIVIYNENAGVQCVRNTVNNVIYLPRVHCLGPCTVQANHTGIHVLRQRLEQSLINILQIMFIGTGDDIRSCSGCDLSGNIVPEVRIAGIFQKLDLNAQIVFDSFESFLQTFGFVIGPDTDGKFDTFAAVVVCFHNGGIRIVRTDGSLWGF